MCPLFLLEIFVVSESAVSRRSIGDCLGSIFPFFHNPISCTWDWQVIVTHTNCPFFSSAGFCVVATL